MLHFGFELFHASHLGDHRPLMQSRCQLIELNGSANRIRLHATIVQISDPSREAQTSRFALHECAKSDALHSSRNQPATRGMFRGKPPAQWICSEVISTSAGIGVDSIAFFTAAQRLCSWNGFAMSAKPFSTT